MFILDFSLSRKVRRCHSIFPIITMDYRAKSSRLFSWLYHLQSEINRKKTSVCFASTVLWKEMIFDDSVYPPNCRDDKSKSIVQRLLKNFLCRGSLRVSWMQMFNCCLTRVYQRTQNFNNRVLTQKKVCPGSA